MLRDISVLRAAAVLSCVGSCDGKAEHSRGVQFAMRQEAEAPKSTATWLLFPFSLQGVMKVEWQETEGHQFEPRQRNDLTFL
jgi:hypothetical protein